MAGEMDEKEKWLADQFDNLAIAALARERLTTADSDRGTPLDQATR